MNIRYATISKTGKRSNNEDAFRIFEDKDNACWMGIVCDGLGGHAMGEVASETVANRISEYWREHNAQPDSEEKVNAACQEASKALDARTESVHVHEMGTTMVMTSIQGDVLTVAHIGDSRCYVVRPDEELLYRTSDHTELSFGWEVVSRCFFSFRQDIARPDVKTIHLQSGDRILLCSDGIYKSMAPSILKGRMMDDKPLDEILDAFDLLCDKSGDDNYTAVLVEVKSIR